MQSFLKGFLEAFVAVLASVAIILIILSITGKKIQIVDK